MNCAFCLEEMNESASVCKVCSREQPKQLTEAELEARRQKKGLILMASIAGLGLAGYLIFFLPDQTAHRNAVRRVTECMRLIGDKDITARSVEMDIEMGIRETGKSWRAGMQYAALFYIRNGLPQRGRCFITQQTLFSD